MLKTEEKSEQERLDIANRIRDDRRAERTPRSCMDLARLKLWDTDTCCTGCHAHARGEQHHLLALPDGRQAKVCCRAQMALAPLLASLPRVLAPEHASLYYCTCGHPLYLMKSVGGPYVENIYFDADAAPESVRAAQQAMPITECPQCEKTIAVLMMPADFLRPLTEWLARWEQERAWGDPTHVTLHTRLERLLYAAAHRPQPLQGSATTVQSKATRPVYGPGGQHLAEAIEAVATKEALPLPEAARAALQQVDVALRMLDAFLWRAQREMTPLSPKPEEQEQG